MRNVGRRSRILWAILAVAAIAASSGAALAVTDEEIFRDFRFNLANPGARSLGLGGAFIAVSDDATAALANPAGLMLLARPEFFTEMRDRTQDSSSITQTLFSADHIQASTDPTAVFSPSFFSYVHPFKRFALGVSRVELTKASNSTFNSFLLDFDPNTPGGAFEFNGVGRIQADLSVWNVSGAVKITDKISFGATVAYGILNMQAGVDNYFVDSTGIIVDPNIVPGGPSLRLYSTGIRDQDADFAFNAGVHWRPLSRLSFGAVYRGGMKFDVREVISNETLLSSPSFFGQTLSGVTGNPLKTSFNTPASYGAGVSWRPLNPLTLSLDWLHIKYKDLLDGFQSGVNVLTLFDTKARFTIDDANEFHFGAEYVFSAGTIPWAVRAGAFTDHNSRIFADFAGSGFSFFSNSDTFPARSTVYHGTIGTGVVVKERFQIDAAADFSSIANEYVLSTIFRF